MDPVCGFVMLIVVALLSSVCCSTGFGDAVQDRHDSTVCLVDSVCGFVMLIVVVLSSVCVVQLALVTLLRIDMTLLCVWWIPSVASSCSLLLFYLLCVLFNWRW